MVPDNPRLAATRARFGRFGIDGFLVTQPENRRYLSHVSASEGQSSSSAGWLAILPRRAVFVTTFLYLEIAQREARGVEVERAPARLGDTAAEVIRDGDVGRLGFDAAHLTVAARDALAAACPDVTLVPVEGLVEELRAVKSADEVETIRRAAALTDAGFARLISVARPEMTEREAAWEIEKFLRENGAEAMAFGPSVAAGPNAAVPHHHGSDEPLGSGRPIWVDLGARVDGYDGDLTRSFSFGPAGERFEEVWRLVLRAQETALRGIRPGMTGPAADALARDVIAAGGHGEAFGHSLGHGVGLAIHERPRVSRFYDDVIPAGSVVTVEPGIYLPGWGGVRIEDLVLVADDGVEVISRAPKPMVV